MISVYTYVLQLVITFTAYMTVDGLEIFLNVRCVDVILVVLVMYYFVQKMGLGD